MTAYSSVSSFGGIYFKIGDVKPSRKPSTLKTTIGKTFVEKDIPLRNTTDIVLSVNGVITGLSQTSAQSKATAIENDRASLIALEDGTYHVYSDGKHSGNFAIIPRSLIWDDVSVRESGEPNKFTVELVEWK